MRGYRQVLVDQERQEYELRANYDDVVPLEESFTISPEEKVFASKDLRAKGNNFTFKRHHKRLIKCGDDISEPPSPFKDYI